MMTDQEAVEVFQAAWHAADDRGEEGSRTLAGIRALRADLSAGKLLPVESISLTISLAQMDRGEVPSGNVASICVAALARLAGVRDWTEETEEVEEPVVCCDPAVALDLYGEPVKGTDHDPNCGEWRELYPAYEEDCGEYDGAPCCPDPGCSGSPCTFPGYVEGN